MILTIANQKGGVGKTTTVRNLGDCFHKKGYRVLLIDSDPQANLTSYFGITNEFLEKNEKSTIDELFLLKKPLREEKWNSFLIQTAPHLDLVASEESLSGITPYLWNKHQKTVLLKNHLQSIQQNYDFILIDTPPEINILTLNALCATDAVLIPIEAAFFSLEGLAKMVQAIENVQKQWNPSLKLAGVVATQVHLRRKLTQEVIDLVEKEFPSSFLYPPIRNCAAIAESTGQGKSILKYRKTSNGTLDYQKLSENLLTRLKSNLNPLKEQSL